MEGPSKAIVLQELTSVSLEAERVTSGLIHDGVNLGVSMRHGKVSSGVCKKWS